MADKKGKKGAEYERLFQEGADGILDDRGESH